MDCSGQAIPGLSRLRRPLFVDDWAGYMATKGSVSVLGDVSSHMRAFDCRPRLAPFSAVEALAIEPHIHMLRLYPPISAAQGDQNSNIIHVQLLTMPF